MAQPGPEIVLDQSAQDRLLKSRFGQEVSEAIIELSGATTESNYDYRGSYDRSTPANFSSFPASSYELVFGGSMLAEEYIVATPTSVERAELSYDDQAYLDALEAERALVEKSEQQNTQAKREESPLLEYVVEQAISDVAFSAMSDLAQSAAIHTRNQQPIGDVQDARVLSRFTQLGQMMTLAA